MEWTDGNGDGEMTGQPIVKDVQVAWRTHNIIAQPFSEGTYCVLCVAGQQLDVWCDVLERGRLVGEASEEGLNRGCTI